LTSSLTETIQNIAIEDTRIWTGCEYIFNLYDNDKDHSFYMSRDHINSLIIDRVAKDNDFDTLLGCQDNCIRVIQVLN
jgi:Bardet-Biedl syndrome 7 protein